MTSASELPLSHARSTILWLAVPPFHSFLPLSFLRIISSPLSLHPLDNLSLPPPPLLSFFFFARLFSFSRFAPSDSRRAVHLGERERERKGAPSPPPSALPPPPPPPPTWSWHGSAAVGRGDRRARRRRKGARSGHD